MGDNILGKWLLADRGEARRNLLGFSFFQKKDEEP